MSEVEVVTVPTTKRIDVSKSVAELYDIPVVLADKIVTTIFEEITESVTLGNLVNIPGFGKFKPVTRSARTGRNPKTGEALDIAEKVTIKFSASSVLKKAVAA